MAGMMSANQQFLVRDQIYSRDLKTLLLDDLQAMTFVRMLHDFPDGNQFNIASIGEAEIADYVEGTAIKYNSLSTGNYPFKFTQYKYSANAISEKFKRDSYWSADVIAAFVPKQHRALMEGIETRILAVANAAQTSGATNIINTAAHRWVGHGPSQSITLADFAQADYALFKANVPQRNKCAVVDPSVAYTLATQTNMVNLLSPSPMWQDIARDGTTMGFKFKFNVYGYDIYISNYLPAIASETIGSSTVTTGVPNYFFSAAPGDTLPWIGAFRQMPTVYSEFNKDLQQEEYVTFTEYDFQIFRPENLVTILTATGVVPTS